MRIIFLGDLAGTGFGSVTMDLGRALLALGHDVRFISQNELGELPEPFASRTFSVNDPAGWMALKAVGLIGLFDGTVWPDGWAPEAGIQLGDVFAVRELVMANELTRAAYRSIPVVHYVPVEGVDLPPTWRALWDILHPVAMSQFGARELAKIIGYEPPVVYHGIDVEQFHPVSAERPIFLTSNDGGMKRTLRSRAECKAMFMHDGSESWSATVRKAEGVRWLLRTDRHMPRKMYASMLRAVAPVLHTHPDAYMVMHCRSMDEGGYLPDTIAKYPPHIAKRMVITGFHDQVGGASRNVLAALYNAADVYLSASAEGFGLTVAEAIACGTPAVGLDYSAVPEVIGPAGLLSPIAGLIDNGYDHFWAVPDERAYGGLVASLLDDDVLRKRLGRAGPAHVRDTFQWDRAAEQFVAAIETRT